MKLFRKMNNCKKSALPFINKALLVVASIFLGVNFTLKACAMPAPVIPEGLTPQVIEGTPATQADQSNMYLTLLYALGLEISEFPSTQGDSVFRDGLNQEDVDAIIESFNELNVQDPTLGDDLRKFMNVQSLIYSQNGQVKEFELPRDLWVRMNKATKNGIDVKIQNPNNGQMPTITGAYVANLFISRGFDISQNSYLMNGCSVVADKANNGGCLIYINAENSGEWATQLVLGGEYDYDDGTRYWFKNWTIVEINNSVSRGNVRSGSETQIPHARTITWYYKDFVSTSPTTSKHIGVASDFISNKANENYDLINKSSSIDTQTGKLTGPVTIASLSASQLQQLQDLINNGFLTLAEAMNRLGIAPYNDSTGILIDSNIDPAAMQQSLAQATSPAPTEPHLSSALSDVDEWNPQSIVPDLPLAGVMNWVAVQMNILMNLSQFQNIWLVISTLAVCVLLIGVARLWK